jgi:hypothetical protein
MLGLWLWNTVFGMLGLMVVAAAGYLSYRFPPKS